MLYSGCIVSLFFSHGRNSFYSFVLSFKKKTKSIVLTWMLLFDRIRGGRWYPTSTGVMTNTTWDCTAKWIFTRHPPLPVTGKQAVSLERWAVWRMDFKIIANCLTLWTLRENLFGYTPPPPSPPAQPDCLLLEPQKIVQCISSALRQFSNHKSD